MAVTKNFTFGMPVAVTPAPDGRTVLFLRSGPRDRRQSLFELDLASGSAREVLSPDAIAKGVESLSPEERARRERMRITTAGFTSFELSQDGARVLVTLSGRLFVLARATSKLDELPTGPGAAIDPHFSPDGTRVAYVRADDLKVIGVAGGREIAITRGGTEARTHGLAEFIAQEELDRYRGFWWSPDGARLLYEEADTSKVERVTIADPAHPEAEPERVAYPHAGKTNAELRFGLVASTGGAPIWVTWDRSRFPYVATVRWEENGPPTMYVLDRAQRNGQLLAIDARTGKTRVLVDEHDDAWLEPDPSVPRFLADGRFFWSREAKFGRMLVLHDASGTPVAGVEQGYRELLDVDPARNTVSFLCGDDPVRQWITHVDLANPGLHKSQLVPDGFVAAARFGAGQHSRFVARQDGPTKLPRTVVWSTAGDTDVEVPSVAEDPGPLPAPKIETIGPDEMRVAILRPRAFDPRAKYPVIDAAYGGPGHNVVAASARTYLLEQWMADAIGAIVVAIDAKGTPNRGRAWSRAIENELARVPLEGHVTAIEALGRAHPEMDTSRVGIYGWSYGGFLSALAVLARPDVYNVAVAGAPVTDWRDYDTAYTERYLGMPDVNKAAYDAASLVLLAAKRPSGTTRPLLLVHGTVDDNVLFANTLKLADAMERAGRPFELVPLVGITHLPYEPDMAEALWTRAAEFLRAGLTSSSGGAPSP
jgi:dipeptidyl-peptidase-4